MLVMIIAGLGVGTRSFKPGYSFGSVEAAKGHPIILNPFRPNILFVHKGAASAILVPDKSQLCCFLANKNFNFS